MDLEIKSIIFIIVYWNNIFHIHWEKSSFIPAYFSFNSTCLKDSLVLCWSNLCWWKSNIKMWVEKSKRKSLRYSTSNWNNKNFNVTENCYLPIANVVLNCSQNKHIALFIYSYSQDGRRDRKNTSASCQTGDFTSHTYNKVSALPVV